MTDPRHQRGAAGEDVAVTALEVAGYRVIKRNYRCRYGELDVIAEHEDTICFIEVRTRQHDGMVDGRSSVDYRKRRKLTQVATYYAVHEVRGERAMRFDVVEVQALPGGGFSTEIIGNAFDAEGAL